MLSMAVYEYNGVHVSDNGISVKQTVKGKRKPSINILKKFMFVIAYTHYCFIAKLHSNYSRCLKPFPVHLLRKYFLLFIFCGLLVQVKLVLFLHSLLSESHCGQNCFKVKKYTKFKRPIE
jgi:hypothetical protein